MLESRLGSDFVAHWTTFPYEDDQPQVGFYKQLPLDGMQFAASYLLDHPSSDRDPLIDNIALCFAGEDLPDPKEEMYAHRARIRICYDRLR